MLRELFDWLDEPWSPSVLEHHEVQSEKGSPETVDGRTRPGDAIDADRVSKWLSVLAEHEREDVRRPAKGWAGFFGYDMDEPLPIEPLVPASSPRSYLLTGNELAERRSRFEGELDLRRPSKPTQEGIFRPAPRRYATRTPAPGRVQAVAARAAASAQRGVRSIRRRLRARRARPRGLM